LATNTSPQFRTGVLKKQIIAANTNYGQNFTTMTGEQTESYIKGQAAVDESVMQPRLKYIPIFRKVLTGKVTALFFQIGVSA
jgi:hypothetical protein